MAVETEPAIETLDHSRARLQPAARTKSDVPLLLLTVVAALSSIAALLLHAVGWVRMPFTISLVSLPGMVLLVCITMWARHQGRQLLLNRIAVGAVAGLVGLVVYDVVRLVVEEALPIHFDAFISLPIFGSLMTGQPVASAIALAAGWGYHISNGLTFAIVYSLIAGPARWWWGLVWGFTLELGMMVVYPAVVRPKSLSGFVVVSVIGHAFFGATVGLLTERKAMPS